MRERERYIEPTFIFRGTRDIDKQILFATFNLQFFLKIAAQPQISVFNTASLRENSSDSFNVFFCLYFSRVLFFAIVEILK